MCMLKEYELDNKYSESLKSAPTHALLGAVSSICLISSSLRSNYCHCKALYFHHCESLYFRHSEARSAEESQKNEMLCNLFTPAKHDERPKKYLIDMNCTIPSPIGRWLGRGCNMFTNFERTICPPFFNRRSSWLNNTSKLICPPCGGSGTKCRWGVVWYQ